jgi:phage recombination protein Bet
MNANLKTTDTSRSLITRFAIQYGIDQSKVLSTLKNTCFKQREGEVSNEQMMALLIVAEKYKLNPFTKEIYAYPDKNNGIVPVVGVDGWASIINGKSTFDGMEFIECEETIELPDAKKCPLWIECCIYDSRRKHPITVKEYLDEVYRPPFDKKTEKGSYKVNGPWQTHTKRMLRHKAMIQCARIAYGFGGIYDQDEAERIIEGEVIYENETTGKPDVEMPEAINEN